MRELLCVLVILLMVSSLATAGHYIRMPKSAKSFIEGYSINVLLLLLIILVASCESKSGRRVYPALQPLTEKVVILDAVAGSSTDYNVMYKVKRVNKGVVTFISLPKNDGRYEKGDTIFYRVQ